MPFILLANTFPGFTHLLDVQMNQFFPSKMTCRAQPKQNKCVITEYILQPKKKYNRNGNITFQVRTNVDAWQSDQSTSRTMSHAYFRIG